MDQQEKRKTLESWGNQLPVGFRIQDRHMREFRLGPIRGSLRRELANLGGSTIFHEHRQVLKHALVDLGDLGPPSTDLLMRLTAPDVEYLLLNLAVRQAPTVEIAGECPNPDCQGGRYKETFSLVETEIVEGTAEITWTSKGDPSSTVKFAGHDGVEHTTIFRIPNLGDQIAFAEEVRRQAKKGEQRLGNAAFQQLSALMVDFDGRGRGLTVDELDAMDLRDLDLLDNSAQILHPPSVDTDLELTCSLCGEVIQDKIDLTEWLVPLGRRQGRGSSSS